jgi:membrane fusion protein, multidrug efflux system
MTSEENLETTAPNLSHRRFSTMDRRSRILIASGIAFVTLITVILLSRGSHQGNKTAAGTAKAAASQGVPITTTTVRKGDIGNYIEALGTVTPLRTVTVFSQVQGQIMTVDYKEGQDVKVGDSLLKIDPRPFQAALLEAEGALERDRALLREARIDLQRYRKAWADRAIQKQLLDDQEQVVYQDEGTVKADEGTLAAAKVNLEYCYIRSPIEGRVGLRLVDPGNILQPNSTTALVVLTQLQPITIIFTVAEDNIPLIQAALQSQLKQGGTMKVEALDRNQKKQIASGTFLTLDNEVDTTTGTVRVRATFENKDGALFPNQFVNARLLVNTDHDATLVATPAIQRGAKGTFVYVVDAHKKAEIRTVKVGISEGETSEVQGLQPGDEVALSGFDKLEDGSKVVIQSTNTKPQIQSEHQFAGSASPTNAATVSGAGSGAPKAP